MIFKVTFSQWLVAFLLAAKTMGGPIITGFNPTVGAPGDQVQITGSGFSTASFNVAFGYPPGVLVTVGSIQSDTLLLVTVPSGAATGPISIQPTTGNPFYTVSNFLVIGSGPYISGFSPVYGSVNDTVIITGVHFVNVLGVSFSGVSAEVSANAAGTQITTRVPLGATNGVITVSTVNGTSNSVASFTVLGPGPFITGFTPGHGDAGTIVQISGLHFTDTTNVTFNGIPGVNLLANSDTFIQVQAPPGLNSGPLAVSTPLGTAVTSSNFYGVPIISSVSPSYGRSGTNVSIVGINLLGASGPSFNGASSVNFSVVNNSNIIAAVPPGATTGLISVVVPGASTFSLSNFVIQPTISGFSPAFGPVGSSVTIIGANLNVGTPVVTFNGAQAMPTTNVTFGQIVAQVPPGASTGPISVLTADGSDTSTNLFYLPASILSFSPSNSAPGSRITITGQNFIGASAVSFNETPAAAFSVTNNVSLGATVPNNVITGPIAVTTPAGTNLSSALFYGPPAITDFTPTHGLPGTNVTIRGLNFLGGNVQFSGLSASIISLNNTQFVATVPSGASSGPITVSGPAGTNTSLSRFILDYTSDLRVSITGTPNPVTVGSNLLYTISVVNVGPFASPNTVFTNMLPPTVTLLSANSTFPWVLRTNGNILSGSTTNFSNGNNSVITLLVVPTVPGNIVDTVSVASDNADPMPQDNSVSVSTTVEPLALLSIKLVADHVTISWPAALTNYLLQFEDGLSLTPKWLAVTNPPAISGETKFVTETNIASARFYRLQR
jgi:hypothetical protein